MLPSSEKPQPHQVTTATYIEVETAELMEEAAKKVKGVTFEITHHAGDEYPLPTGKTFPLSEGWCGISYSFTDQAANLAYQTKIKELKAAEKKKSS